MLGSLPSPSFSSDSGEIERYIYAGEFTRANDQSVPAYQTAALQAEAWYTLRCCWDSFVLMCQHSFASDLSFHPHWHLIFSGGT
jgi:hypothetical protein